MSFEPTGAIPSSPVTVNFNVGTDGKVAVGLEVASLPKTVGTPTPPAKIEENLQIAAKSKTSMLSSIGKGLSIAGRGLAVLVGGALYGAGVIGCGAVAAVTLLASAPLMGLGAVGGAIYAKAGGKKVKDQVGRMALWAGNPIAAIMLIPKGICIWLSMLGRGFLELGIKGNEQSMESMQKRSANSLERRLERGIDIVQIDSSITKLIKETSPSYRNDEKKFKESVAEAQQKRAGKIREKDDPSVTVQAHTFGRDYKSRKQT